MENQDMYNALQDHVEKMKRWEVDFMERLEEMNNVTYMSDGAEAKLKDLYIKYCER